MEVESVERHVTDGGGGGRVGGAIRKDGGEGEGRFHEFGVSMFANFGFCPSVRPCRNPPPRHAVAMLQLAQREEEVSLHEVARTNNLGAIVCILATHHWSRLFYGVAFALLLSLSRRHRSGRSRDSQLNCGVKFYRKTSKISSSPSLDRRHRKLN